jgi:Fic family protein
MEKIKISNFSSGTWVNQFEYKSFRPNLINREWEVDDIELQTLIADANRFLGELNAFSQLVPDIDFFIRMHINKEAVKSSQIEGTYTTIEEALMKEEEIKPEKRDDWKEVNNYIKAMDFAIKKLLKLPVSNRFIRDVHNILLTGTRGETKQPGEFRKSQNWIAGATIRDAVFIPPHHTELPMLMDDLEQFINNEKINISELLRIAITHYQFETIHPFLDGNGRVGRLLITLKLVNRNLLVKPALYLSDFFEKNKILYYENLMKVRISNDMNQWLKFFMVGVIETSKNSIQAFKDIIELKEKIYSQKLNGLGKKRIKGELLLQELFKNPITSVTDVMQKISTTRPTANTLVKDFQKLGILRELTGFKRNRIFLFSDYIKIFL